MCLFIRKKSSFKSNQGGIFVKNHTLTKYSQFNELTEKLRTAGELGWGGQGGKIGTTVTEER